MAREGVILKCETCKEHNYITKVNKKQQTEKLRVKKYCSRCNGSVFHIQTKPKK